MNRISICVIDRTIYLFKNHKRVLNCNMIVDKNFRRDKNAVKNYNSVCLWKQKRLKINVSKYLDKNKHTFRAN